MMLAIKYAREQKVPFLGICLGFQLAVVEWARDVLNIPGAHTFSDKNATIAYSASHFVEATSAEFDPSATHPLIVFMPEISKTHMGGTMRLGLRPTVFGPDTEKWSKTRKLYGGAGTIWERHRHRYEVNPAFVDRLAESGMVFAGQDEKGERMQVCELRGAFPLFFLSFFVKNKPSLPVWIIFDIFLFQ
jgi:CTP synthase